MVKDMTTNFGKLDKFEGHDFRRWQKKMHFLLTTLKVVYVLTRPMPELLEDATVEAIRIRAKWENDDYICRGHILNGMSNSLFYVYTNVELAKELWDSLESKYIAEDSSSKKFLGKGKEVAGPSVNMTEEGKNKNKKQNKGKKRDFKEHGIAVVVKRTTQMLVVRERGLRTIPKTKVDAIAWWIDSGATTHVCKYRCWFKTYEPVEDESVLYMGDDLFAPVHGKGSVMLEFSLGKSITLFNVLYVPKPHKNLISGPVLNKCGYKQVYESDKYILSKCGVFVGFGYYNNGMFMLNLNKVLDDSDSVYMSSSAVVNSLLWHARLGHIHYKRMLEMSKDELIPAIDENPDKCNKKYVITFIDDASRFCYVYLLHAKDEALDKFRIYKTEESFMKLQLLIHHSKMVWLKGKNRALKEMVNSMTVVRLPDPKRKTLGEKGINCIFVGYAEHSKAYRFYVIEPNDSVSMNSIIESRDAIFDKNRFSSIPRPKDIIPNSDESQRDDLSDDVPNKIPEPRKGKRVRKAKSYGSDFQLYLVEGSRDQKEAIDDEIGSIMENNIWVLSDLPPGCKPLGCKWIFKRKMKVDGAIDKFKARLVIQGFRQKEGIDYFDTYAPVARITTIRLLLVLAAIHNLVINQMDVKTTFLNGDLEEEVYMKHPEGFVMSGNEHKVCKLVKSMYGLKQAPKQCHQKFDEVVLSSGFLLNQSDKFSMKDIEEADVILGIKIKHENKRIVITQSHYIEKILKKFNHEDCSPVSTLMDPVEKLTPNTGKPVHQLEYSRVIGCLMYAMTSTRPNIAYAVSRLGRFTSNPSRQHWQAIKRVFKYLKGTINYGLSYVGYPLVLEAYSDASCINHVEDSSSTSGWVILLGGGAISWASKKQTCITGSTIESKFVALSTVGKEAEWLTNLIHKIPIWLKPIAPIFIRCDSAPTMAKAYSQIYNGKFRHLGVRHSMVRDLIRNGVISIEFVRTQHNLADHLTKGLARDLMIKCKNKKDRLCEHEVLPLQEA
ncbi:zinc finger, CCHC-type containing protein [Tanacetum coccineum]